MRAPRQARRVICVAPTAKDRHRRALLLFRSDERPGQRRSARGRWPPQQSSGEFAPAVSTTRTSHAAVSKHEDSAEVQLSSRPGPQPFQSGSPSRHPPSVQAETLCRIGGVARPCGVNHRSPEGMSRYASTKPGYFDNAALQAAEVRWRQAGSSSTSPSGPEGVATPIVAAGHVIPS